eukprot:Gb_34210 [translate_table: standard]
MLSKLYERLEPSFPVKR